MLHLHFPAVKAFLDQLDNILNSRTFLLSLPFLNHRQPAAEWQQKLSEYLHSQAFTADMIAQYAARRWSNFVELQGAEFRPKALPRFERIVYFRSYLAAMLIADHSQLIACSDSGIAFYSPYQKNLPPKKAPSFVNAFLAGLFASNAGRIEAWALSTDFIAASSDIDWADQAPRGRNWLYYFDGWTGIPTDSATLLMNEERAYLLLTNGND
jgi:hypothetical protein